MDHRIAAEPSYWLISPGPRDLARERLRLDDLYAASAVTIDPPPANGKFP